MTALELERKLAGLCPRCGAPAGETNLCEPHRVDLNARVRASQPTTRRGRRERAALRAARRLLPRFTATA